MPIARAGKSRPVRVARFDKGTCGICHKQVSAGEAYEYGLGTTTENQRLVHYNCYKPSNAPDWEALQKKKQSRKH